MVLAVLASKKKVRKTPAASSTTKQYMPSSPSRNAQWSGKTLLRASSAKAAAPRRSSIQAARRLSTVPEAGADRLGVVAPGDEVALAVDVQRELREGGRRGAARRLCPVQHVEDRLVAGAEQLVGVGPVEPHRTPGMGADLGERDHVVGRPSLPPGQGPVVARRQADQQGLGVLDPDGPLGGDGEGAGDRQLGGPQRLG